MQEPSKIAHPLKNRTGTSQRTRLIDALQPEAAPIDGKTLSDRLYLICEYAGYINFHTYVNDAVEGEYQQLDTWTSFFANSLPFQLAKLGKVSVDELEAQFLALYDQLKANPTKQSLESLLGFVYDKLIAPTDGLYKTVAEAKNSFTVPLLSIIKSSFLEPVKCYIALYNSSATFLCVDKRNFTDYLAQPWQLKVEEVYALDLCIKRVKKGKKEGYILAADVLNTIFYQMLNGLQDIVEEAPLFIEESLRPLEESLRKKHQAHLALLFTFLELLKYFQGNINELGKKHLDFFYEQVLKMVPKEAVPDKAHIVFEVAKHLEAYPLPKDLLLKDGKDANKQDIQFGLDHEIVLDKAQVKEVRTLSLYPVEDIQEHHLEGVYIAPVANTADGMGKAFEKEQPVNWATLGSKYSKYIQEENTKPDEHPKARLGFALASPVLLLQEGERTINISLSCTSDPGFVQKISPLYDTRPVYGIEGNILTEFIALLQDEVDSSGFQHSDLAISGFKILLDKKFIAKVFEDDLVEFLDTTHPDTGLPIFTNSLSNQITNLFVNPISAANILNKQLFAFRFSGEKDWLEPKMESTIVELEQTATGVNFQIQIDLDKDFPAIVFFVEENLNEKLDIKKKQPVLKIELVEDCVIECDIESEPSLCCLKKRPSEKSTIDISPYELFKSMLLTNAQIEVKVCGVKDLIVQNDDGLLDINSELFPFGLRPDVPGFDPMNQLDVDPGPGPPPPIPIGERNTDPLLGPSFYIGSKEVLFKKWDSVRVNMEWKNKPQSFHDHYKAYLKDKNIPAGSFDITDFGLTEENFKLQIDKLDNGNWTDMVRIELFEKAQEDFGDLYCDTTVYAWEVNNTEPSAYVDYDQPLEVFKHALDGFLKFTLAEQDFLHSEYPFVLARQMLAYAYSSEGKLVTDAIYFEESNKTIISPVKDILDSLGLLPDLSVLIDQINDSFDAITGAIDDIEDYIENELTGPAANTAISLLDSIANQVDLVKDFLLTWPPTAAELPNLFNAITDLPNPVDFITITNPINDLILEFQIDGDSLLTYTEDLKNTFNVFVQVLDDSNILNILDEEGLQALIPNEPWTPAIKNMHIDYSATADIADMEIIHLYPFENTSRHEDILAVPTFLPTYDDEGSLFIGFENLVPLTNVFLLFQLAEATADSELDKTTVKWHYLTNNNWRELRPDFDIISDETDGLTVSGIVTIAIPENINTVGNTIMPDHLYWIKVSAPENVRAVAETIGIHTQAAKASARLDESNDTGRLETALEAGSIGKLQEGDFSIKKVEQPYSAFGGRKPEAEGHFYTRVSEHLKHKGRGLMINDYEKVVLEGFPEIYKVKCISHTMGLSANEYRRDLEIAPGFVVVAVIPDLTKLKAGNQLEPKAPVSLLEKIGDHLRKKISPFARLKIMNPRYEAVDVCVSVRLYRGKSESFYAKKLQEDLTFFLAPWFLGDTEKLAFGEEVLFSDVVGFIEQLDYVHFIVDLKLEGVCEQTGTAIQPLTARSILTAGTICVNIEKEKCPEPSSNDIATELI